MGKVYTKSGDDGFTSLASGKRVKKGSDIIELYGACDELSVFLAHAAESLYSNQDFKSLLKQIYRVQREVFGLSLYLLSGKSFAVSSHDVSRLEDEIDSMSEKLPVLQSFILPGGGEGATRIHLARTACRRAERVAFRLAEEDRKAEMIGIYLNRLGDWLYMAARTAALIVNAEEILVEDI